MIIPQLSLLTMCSTTKSDELTGLCTTSYLAIAIGHIQKVFLMAVIDLYQLFSNVCLIVVNLVCTLNVAMNAM